MATKGTPAVRAVEAAGVAYRLLEYDYDPNAAAIGLAAAEALGLDPALVYKTLVCQLEGGPAPGLACAIIPAAARLDLKALAAAAKAKKSDLAPQAVAERSSGYVVGGISPLGQRRKLPTFLDRSAEALAEIIVNGGRRGLQLALAPADLIKAADAQWADITVRQGP
ncbi:Cys-tRNA(Pro) deacylase [Nitrospirillum pindoramense]|uniref:Cys-tRNA(Pro)/Cys-tRNA(Cys) deacylase n=1 Tax=Nitrospirillum amazonense TaxID=28077 RepID=A0A560HAP5_9PROT|nr:Cys-tRNA(Pro) deacylase [Nitrospirillum amazonense]TWB43407.1 Cys-tRNA(Pro)/Cys-tRNA(Cys) deacylase [Nitrospirillum amazonense]